MLWCVFFFPFSVVLAAQNVSALPVTDGIFKTVQDGVTDPPYSLNCLEQGKTLPHIVMTLPHIVISLLTTCGAEEKQTAG